MLARVRALLRRAPRRRQPTGRDRPRRPVRRPGAPATAPATRGERVLDPACTESAAARAASCATPAGAQPRADPGRGGVGRRPQTSSNGVDVYIGDPRRKLEAGGRAATRAHRPRRRIRAAAMTLRGRLALIAAGAVSIAVVAVALTAWLLARAVLLAEVDDRLTAQARLTAGVVAEVQQGQRPQPGRLFLDRADPDRRADGDPRRPGRPRRWSAPRSRCHRTTGSATSSPAGGTAPSARRRWPGGTGGWRRCACPTAPCSRWPATSRSSTGR